MSYLSGESKRQITWKLLTKSLPKKAKEPGLYGSRLHAVCLPIDWAHHNLYPGIRSEIIETFSRERIVFHGSALPGMPSNHLCSSQVMAINIFAIFEQQPEVLKAYLLPFIPDIAGFVSFPSGRYVEMLCPPPPAFEEVLVSFRQQAYHGVGIKAIAGLS